MPVIPALRRQRQEDQELEASQGCIARPFLNNNNSKKPNQVNVYRVYYMKKKGNKGLEMMF
jgi:hypothetical protein